MSYKDNLPDSVILATGYTLIGETADGCGRWKMGARQGLRVCVEQYDTYDFHAWVEKGVNGEVPDIEDEKWWDDGKPKWEHVFKHVQTEERLRIVLAHVEEVHSALVAGKPVPTNPAFAKIKPTPKYQYISDAVIDAILKASKGLPPDGPFEKAMNDRVMVRLRQEDGGFVEPKNKA